MIIPLLCLTLVSASDVEDQILASINTDFSLISGRKESHFSLQEGAWVEFDTAANLVQAVLLLNATDSKQLSLHHFEFNYETAGVLRLQHMKQHSSPQCLDLEPTEAGLILEAISNCTNSTVEAGLFLDDGSKQELLVPSYASQEMRIFKLLQQQFAHDGGIYYAATFINSTGDRLHFLTYRNESSFFGNGGFARSGGLEGIVIVFIVTSVVTYAGMVYYWRKFDKLPWQKRKEESSRVVLDSSRVKSSV